MTDTSHSTYAVAIALVVFFLTWAAVAASRGRRRTGSTARGARAA